MGLLSKNNDHNGKTIYNKQVLPNLVNQDGHKHIIMVTSFSKWNNQAFGVVTKFTAQLGYIVDQMQNDGYEILDIEHSTLKNQGIFGEMEGFHTLITYR